MARTIEEILTEANEAQKRLGELYTAITDEVNADADLTGLNSPSKTAEFRLWKYVFSALAYIQEQIWGEREESIQAIVDTGITGTDAWLHSELLTFQYGDSLSFDSVTKKYFYAVVDPAKQIIKRCAVISSAGVTFIKVAKEDGSGNPIALTGDELTSFSSFVRQVQWAGSNIANPTSGNSDKLDAPMTVYYDATNTLSAIKSLVQNAFNEYLKALPFNGQYMITGHQDAIQAVAGVNDVVMGTVRAKADGGAHANVNRVYIPVAGYIERDTTIDFDTMINYVPQ